MAQFRGVSFYLNNKKIAELEETKVKFMTNGEQMTGTDEVLGESDGIVTTEASWNVVIPVDGTEIDMDLLLINQTPVQLGFLKGGRIIKVDGKLIDGETTATMKSGVTKGVYNFRGGKPSVIG